MVYLLCECGKRYTQANETRHFDSIFHKKFISNKKQEIHIIVHDIDKDKLIKFIKNNCNNSDSESSYSDGSGEDETN